MSKEGKFIQSTDFPAWKPVSPSLGNGQVLDVTIGQVNDLNLIHRPTVIFGLLQVLFPQHRAIWNNPGMVLLSVRYPPASTTPHRMWLHWTYIYIVWWGSACSRWSPKVYLLHLMFPHQFLWSLRCHYLLATRGSAWASPRPSSSSWNFPLYHF